MHHSFRSRWFYGTNVTTIFPRFRARPLHSSGAWRSRQPDRAQDFETGRNGERLYLSLTMMSQAWADFLHPIREPETGPMFRRILIRALAAGLLSASAAPVFASAFDFMPAPQTDLNRVYRIDKGHRRGVVVPVRAEGGDCRHHPVFSAPGRGQGAGSGRVRADRIAP